MSIALQAVTKRFTSAGTPAVADVSFEAPRGAITAVLGPSGAGKSTVLRLVAGLEVPDFGKILIDGEDCAHVPVQKRGIGLVFQNYALFRHMTVAENVAFGLSVRHVPRKQVTARVTELLQLVQLERLADRYPAQLSGGQRQRIAFARALAVRPRVLLLDEPFGALDANVRRELRDWLEQLHAGMGVTTLLVTHDQEEALELAQHVVLMFDGRIAQSGPPGEVYDRPASPKVASFLGGANLLTAPVFSGRADFGAVEVAAPHSARDGELLQVFVRPHDLKLRRVRGKHPGLAVARIERVKRIGGYVRISLALPGGEVLTVESPRSEIDALGVVAGEPVLVDLRAARPFAEHAPH
jgi:sulfate transport system ATP-binding protein